jgi:hypothetical protein
VSLGTRRFRAWRLQTRPQRAASCLVGWPPSGHLVFPKTQQTKRGYTSGGAGKNMPGSKPLYRYRRYSGPSRGPYHRISKLDLAGTALYSPTHRTRRGRGFTHLQAPLEQVGQAMRVYWGGWCSCLPNRTQRRDSWSLQSTAMTCLAEPQLMSRRQMLALPIETLETVRRFVPGPHQSQQNSQLVQSSADSRHGSRTKYRY